MKINTCTTQFVNLKSSGLGVGAGDRAVGHKLNNHWVTHYRFVINVSSTKIITSIKNKSI